MQLVDWIVNDVVDLHRNRESMVIGKQSRRFCIKISQLGGRGFAWVVLIQYPGVEQAG